MLEVLELANMFADEFSIVIVDNGSTDETYETACELARTYPQIKVLRQSVRQGLGRVLEMVRKAWPPAAIAGTGWHAVRCAVLFPAHFVGFFWNW